LFFDDMCELSTPSVLLTVIAGLGYHGSSSIYETLVEVAQNLAATALSEAAPVVRNPGDSSEIISEKWHSLPDAWLQFRRWSAELARLLPHATDPLVALETMVGRDSVKRGFELQAKVVAAARQSGNLRVSNTGKLAASAASSGTLVKPHHFYGE
jgi:hypothetical protein